MYVNRKSNPYSKDSHANIGYFIRNSLKKRRFQMYLIAKRIPYGKQGIEKQSI
jgi:hypothetical protein